MRLYQSYFLCITQRYKKQFPHQHLGKESMDTEKNTNIGTKLLLLHGIKIIIQTIIIILLYIIYAVKYLLVVI